MIKVGVSVRRSNVPSPSFYSSDHYTNNSVKHHVDCESDVDGNFELKKRDEDTTKNRRP